MIIKDYFWIDDKYKNIFESSSLTGFKDIFNDTLGQLIRVEPEKTIRYFEVNQQGSVLGFYVKQENPNLLSHIKHYLKRRSLYRLNTRHELDLIRLYERQGVSVVEPAAWGEQRILGIPIRGFLVQKEVVGREFIHLMKEGSVAERIKLIRAYGKFVAELHSKGLISTVARVTDLLCTSPLEIPWQDITLVVIDREKGPLELEFFSMEEAGYALSSILVRFFIYIDAPSNKEVKCFLQTYLEHLDVDDKPSFRNIFLNTQSHFKVMMKTYRSHIDSDHLESLCIS